MVIGPLQRTVASQDGDQYGFLRWTYTMCIIKLMDINSLLHYTVEILSTSGGD